MPGLVLGGVGTFVVSLIVAYWFLRIRCRGIGPPFGRRARYWASFIVVSTAALAAAVGVLILPPAASRAPCRGHRAGRSVVHQTAPAARPGHAAQDVVRRADPPVQPPVRPDGRRHAVLVRYQDRGGEAQAAVDSGRRAVLLEPDEPDHRSAGAGQSGPLAGLHRAQDQHGAADRPGRRPGPAAGQPAVARLDGARPQVQRRRPGPAGPAAGDRGAERAHLFLAYAYRLGYHKMLIYPFRPGAHRPAPQPPPKVQPVEPVTPER